ncbi:MAG: nucleoid-associated protein [Bacteroidales bacterium]|nr:nucleoid-associated protein [Bacteroidales bacterium]
MLDFSNAHLNKVILHKTGNKAREEQLIISESELEINESIKEMLQQFFLGHFCEEAFYSFKTEIDNQDNDVFVSVKNIFSNSENFISESKTIATKLFDAGNHPKIKSGDLYIATFSDLVVDDELVDAVGIFKSETKQDFLRIDSSSNGFDIKIEEGINLNKIDKACLVYNTEQDFGFKINIIDNVNKQSEAQYWRNDFLGIEQRKDDFYQTQKYMELCKDFVQEVYNEEHEVEKPQQIAMLNKSAKYFKENESFDKKDFEENVLSQPEVIEAFNTFSEQYAEEKNVQLADSFEISENAAKKAQTKMKGVLKLDKNFHIYIHGDETRIRRGVDPESGMKFYQFYYDEEE